MTTTTATTITENDFRYQLGKRLATRRKQLGLSLQAVSQRVGFGFQSIHRYEIGEDHPNAFRLFLVAKALDTTVGELFDGLGA